MTMVGMKVTPIEAVVEALLANGGDANAEDKKHELQGQRIPADESMRIKSHGIEDPTT